MGIDNILKREHEITKYIFSDLSQVQTIRILAKQHQNRLGVLSFYIDELHFNLGVKLLNDRYGIQTRGGCSCAGTYGHYLLHVDKEMSNDLVCQITSGDLIKKPGWIRMSIHPTTTTEEIKMVCDAIKELAKNHQEWSLDYVYNSKTNEFAHKNYTINEKEIIKNGFDF